VSGMGKKKGMETSGGITTKKIPLCGAGAITSRSEVSGANREFVSHAPTDVHRSARKDGIPKGGEAGTLVWQFLARGATREIRGVHHVTIRWRPAVMRGNPMAGRKATFNTHSTGRNSEN